MVGARDSVPSLGPNMPFCRRPLPEPGRGGGVISIGLGGFGEGAAEEAVLIAVFGVVFLVLLVDSAGPGAGPGAAIGLLLNVKWAGTGALAQDSGCFSSFDPFWAVAVPIVFIIGDGPGRLDVGDGGTE